MVCKFLLLEIEMYLYWYSKSASSPKSAQWDNAAALTRHLTQLHISPSSTMSGTSGHFPDAFSNNSYSIPYTHVSHPDFNILSHTHTSEVSCTSFHENCFY